MHCVTRKATRNIGATLAHPVRKVLVGRSHFVKGVCSFMRFPDGAPYRCVTSLYMRKAAIASKMIVNHRATLRFMLQISRTSCQGATLPFLSRV